MPSCAQNKTPWTGFYQAWSERPSVTGNRPTDKEWNKIKQVELLLKGAGEMLTVAKDHIWSYRHHVTSGSRWLLPQESHHLQWRGAFSPCPWTPQRKGPPPGEGIPGEKLRARIRGNASISWSHLSGLLKLAELHRPIPSKPGEPQFEGRAQASVFFKSFHFLYSIEISERQPKIEATNTPDAWVHFLALHQQTWGMSFNLSVPQFVPLQNSDSNYILKNCHENEIN